MTNTFEQLQAVTAIGAASGFEKPVADYLQTLWQPLTDEQRVDPMGNFIAVKKGTGDEPRRRILFATHMDEIGLMVSDIVGESETADGFLRVTNLGGIDKRQIHGQLVTVHGRREFTGVVGTILDKYLLKDRPKSSRHFDNVVIDTGYSLAELRKLTRVGDSITFQQPTIKLLNKRVASKALDNRLSIVILTQILELLATRTHEWDVLAVGTVQEESGLIGAGTVGFSERPDLAIALDVDFSTGPNTSDNKSRPMSKGPVMVIGSNFHAGFVERIQKSADNLELPLQRTPYKAGSGTDAAVLQLAGEGIPTALLGAPIRSMHTSVETADMHDIERCAKVLAETVVNLDANTLDEMAAGMFI